MSKIDIKTDCFAFKKGNCSALKDLYCENEECSFYKTYKQILEEQLILSKQRIN